MRFQFFYAIIFNRFLIIFLLVIQIPSRKLVTKLTREEGLRKVLKSYEAYYDVEECEVTAEFPLVATCSFYVHSEKYVLVKKAKLWSADSNEYVYIFSVPVFNKTIYEKCRDYAYEKGMALIDPKPGHMYTYITTLFVCDQSEKDAVRALKRCRLHKNFQFSLLGWMDFHTALIDLATNKVYTNGSGHENAKFLKSIIHAMSFR